MPSLPANSFSKTQGNAKRSKAAVVLKPAIVDFGSMAVGRNVAAIRGAERETHRRGAPGGLVDDLAVEPDLLALQNLNARARRRGATWRQFASRLGGVKVERVGDARLRVPEPKGGRRACSNFRVQVAVTGNLLSARAEAWIRRLQPRLRLEPSRKPLTRHHT